MVEGGTVVETVDGRLVFTVWRWVDLTLVVVVAVMVVVRGTVLQRGNFVVLVRDLVVRDRVVVGIVVIAKIHGTDGSGYPPFRTGVERMTIFSTDICR